MSTEERGIICKAVLSRPDVQEKLRAAKRKPVVIHGVEYRSQLDAADILNINHKTLADRVRSKSPTWADWKFLSDDNQIEMNRSIQ